MTLADKQNKYRLWTISASPACIVSRWHEAIEWGDPHCPVKQRGSGWCCVTNNTTNDCRPVESMDAGVEYVKREG